MIYTSVTIAGGGTTTIPRSTDLANSIFKGSGSAYVYSQIADYTGGWGRGGEVTAISSTTYTVKNKMGSEATLYYGYRE